jgi:hypothetical protein
MFKGVIYSSLEEADIRDKLIEYRDQTLVPKFPAGRRDEGLLRRRMIDALLRHKPRTVIEFHEMIPEYLISSTDPAQLKGALPAVLQLLNRLLATKVRRISRG